MKRIIITIIIFFFSVVYFGQLAKHISYSSFNLDNAYVSNYYQTIIMDNQIWLNAGFGDIVKYDILNDNFSTFDQNICPDLSSNEEIYPIHFSDDTLVFYYKYAGLYSYAKNANSLSNIDTPTWPENIVYDNGRFWHGVYGEKGLYLEDGGSQMIFDHTNSSIPDSSIERISMGANGEVWILYQGAFGKFHNNIYTQYDFPLPFAFSPSPLKVKMYPDSFGNVWLVNYSDGLLKFDGNNFTIYNTANSNLSTNELNDVTGDSLGNLWISGDDGVLLKFNGTDFNEFDYKTFLNFSFIIGFSVNLDDFDNIWITTNQGLIVYNESQIQGPLSVLENIEETSTLSVYPNPSSEIINFKLNTEEILKSIKIYTILGELVMTKRNRIPKVEIQNLPSGHYIVNIETTTGIKHSSFIKE